MKDIHTIGYSIYTVGHSNIEVNQFINLIKEFEINCIVDVRSVPYSKYAFQFNVDTLKLHLKKNNIEYVYLGKELGARQDLKYCSDGYLDFELYSQSPSFSEGINRLLSGIEKGFKIAIMCAEKNPLECHRSILITRHLKDLGINVFHILHEKYPWLVEGRDFITQTELENIIIDLSFQQQLSLFDNAYDSLSRLRQAYRIMNRKIYNK